MPYTPPVGTVDLNLIGRYTPPVGTVDLNLAPAGDARDLSVAARAGSPRAQILAGSPVRTWLSARTSGARASASIAYDPNLLSEVCTKAASHWQRSDGIQAGISEPIQETGRLWGNALDTWRSAVATIEAIETSWNQAGHAEQSVAPIWREARSETGLSRSAWNQSALEMQPVQSGWRGALVTWMQASSGFRAQLPVLTRGMDSRFMDGEPASQHWSGGMQDGPRIEIDWSTVWGNAGLAFNAWQPPAKPPQPPQPPSGFLVLNLRRRPLSLPLLLNLGGDIFWNIHDRRYYGVLNTCSVVRLPDRTELPVTAVSVETDCDSWAWSVSLSLAGPDAWALCRPNPLPAEVEISINGLLWTALLDDPQLTRGFNNARIGAKGLSRSAWLTTPYTPSATVEQIAPRTAQQVAEEILDGTGWALDWQLPLDPQWLIPGGHYRRTGTPIERLVGLIAAVKGCLYSDPAGYVLTAHPRYPALPWHWDSVNADYSLPESALLSWNQTQQDRPAVNRVYVSGTTAGVLMQLTRAGTAGDLCASEPIVDALLTDSYAARHRAEMELAGAGAGYEVSVETILGGTAAIPLIRPGMLCEFAGIRGIVRSTSIGVSRNGSGLAVRQGLKLERRMT